MFDCWTSDIAEVKKAASDFHCMILAEMEAGVKVGITSSFWQRH